MWRQHIRYLSFFKPLTERPRLLLKWLNLAKKSDFGVVPVAMSDFFLDNIRIYGEGHCWQRGLPSWCCGDSSLRLQAVPEMQVSASMLHRTDSAMGCGNLRRISSRLPIAHGIVSARCESCRPSPPQATDQHRGKASARGPWWSQKCPQDHNRGPAQL